MTILTQSNMIFTCPIFNAETKMKDCVKLRDMLWRGSGPDVRRGCQACMHAGKCPVTRIVQKTSFIKGYIGSEYYSEEATKGKIYAEDLERIENTVVMENTMNAYRVSLAERELILSAGERITKQLGTAPRNAPKKNVVIAGKSTPRGRSAPRRVATPEPVAQPKINTAAATGDLTAAINGETA